MKSDLNSQREGQCRVDGLTFRYFERSERNIISDLSLTFPAGQVTVILGSSGCGKSTLAAVMCGLYPENGGFLEKGNVTVDGENVQEIPFGKRCRKIAAMFQNPDLQFCMHDLKEEFLFCLENMCVPQNEMEDKVRQACEEYGVADLIDKPFSIMSGGEKQRAALACLLLEKPKVLVLDEPFANLDYVSIGEYLKLLEKNIKKEQLTVIAIDHKAENWFGYADMYLILGENCRPVHIENSGLPEGFVAAGKLRQAAEILEKNGIQNPFEQTELKKGRKETETELPVVELIDAAIYHKTKKTLRYRGRQIPAQLEKLNLKAGKGEMIALTGPSGSGKTTLFLSLLGQKDVNGVIKINGRDIQKIKPREIFGRIGIVFQNPAIQFVTTEVYSEIESSLKIWRGKEAENFKEIVNTFLEKFNLHHYRRYSPFMLSQGQQRRLAVLTMLAGGQNILLMDEPTYGQDGMTTKAIMTEMCERAKEGITVIFTTHDVKTALLYADRIWQVQGNTVREISHEALKDQLCIYGESEAL